MNIEEKAKRYVKGILSAYKEDAEIDFTAGYTQAVTDLSAENEKLREALRKAIDYLGAFNLTVNNYTTKTFIEKAKQLITEEK